MAAAADPPSRPRSPHRGGTPSMLRRWLMEWAWGSKSASSVSADARAYCEDQGRRNVDHNIQLLDRARGNGSRAQLILENVLPMGGVLEPDRLESSAVEWVLQPHVVLEWLQQHCAAKFRVHFGAEEEGVLSFWTKLRLTTSGQNFWQLHPWLRDRTPEDLRFHLPVCVFDDAGPISNSQSSYVRQWYSILGTGADRETRMLLCIGLTSTGMEDKSWPLILDSFSRLARPQPPGQYGAVLLFFCGDLDYVCNVVGFPHFNKEDNMCSLCLANNSTRQHNDWSAGAGWMGYRSRQPDLHGTPTSTPPTP